ncbi:F-actin-capping protein subunit alpha [Scheffersomyces coipomensis]|uniref:F-actin-capping protein subunit alpha n=1 Tax=Scheffersomyces coipomensis TaxID=1788519 RepID=UPI00315DC639
MASIKLDQLVDKLVESAPPGELKEVGEGLSSLVSSPAVINESLESYIQKNGAVFSGKYIASSYNKDESSTKYIDYVSKKKFNVDLQSNRVTDIESFVPSVTYPPYFEDVVSTLETYGEDHYPSGYAFTVIPVSSSSVRIIIIGQRLNNENYYTGQWKSNYLIDGSNVSGTVKLDIHYYEDGNVRLNFDEKVSTSLNGSITGSEIVNVINNAENKITLQIVDDFNQLNQKYFKNLRRLLPITRSKINWGNAIGNYRLGSDVVNKQ